jgi:hypothetical protein
MVDADAAGDRQSTVITRVKSLPHSKMNSHHFQVPLWMNLDRNWGSLDAYLALDHPSIPLPSTPMNLSCCFLRSPTPPLERMMIRCAEALTVSPFVLVSTTSLAAASPPLPE